MGVEVRFIEIVYQCSDKIEKAPNQLNLILFTKKQDQRYFDPAKLKQL